MAAEKKDEEVTLKRSELEAMLSARDKAAKRTPEETAIRSAMREEIDSALDEKLTAFFDLDSSSSGGENDGGDADGGFFGQLMKAFGQSS
jgi:hypothetical protein